MGKRSVKAQLDNHHALLDLHPANGRAVANRGAGGAGGAGGASAPPPVFGQTVNPMSTRGQIIPTTVLQAPPPWIFRPCDGPEWGSQTVPKYSLAASMAGWGIF